MTVRAGDCVISHPRWSDEETVIFITEHTKMSTVGLQLNRRSEHTFESLGISGLMTDTVFEGGEANPGALIMLHTTEWYSSNTMPINEKWSISSDHHMLEKIADGNMPIDFRCCMGISYWQPNELDLIVKDPKSPWLVVKQPGPELVMSNPEDQWANAIKMLSSNIWDEFFV
jgi:putative AlgH/UPF0301 family transcriptional regulator